MLTRQEIDKIVKSPKVKEFQAASWFLGADNNQIESAEWEKRPLKVLVTFLSPGKTRSVANTFNAIQEEIGRVSPDEVFVDYAYYPFKGDLEKFEETGLPYWFGNVSHAPVQDYDLILVSTAILVECLNIFHAFKSCGIPIYHKDRTNRADIPLIMLGGIPTSDHDCLGGNSGVPDVEYLGYAEGVLGQIITGLLERKKAGKNLKEAKLPIIKWMVKNFDNIYYPNGYDVEYEGFKIKSIKPNLEWVPEKVKFHLEYDLDKFNGWENKVFNPDGSAADGVDFLISAGCTSGGSCYFSVSGEERIPTKDGLLKLKDVREDVGTDFGFTEVPLTKWYNEGSKPCLKISTRRGYDMVLTSDHEVEYFDGLGVKSKQAGDLKIGESLLLQAGSRVFGKKFTEVEAAFIGHMVGDGSYNTKMSLFANEEEKEYSRKVLESVGLEYTAYEKVRGVTEFAILGKTRVRERFGFEEYSNDDERKKIPEGVFRSSRKSILKFLRGYYLTDGSFYENGNVTFASKDLNLIKETQLLLLSLGYTSSINKDERDVRGGRHGFKDRHRIGFRLIMPVRGSSVLRGEWKGLEYSEEALDREVYDVGEELRVGLGKLSNDKTFTYKSQNGRGYRGLTRAVLKKMRSNEFRDFIVLQRVVFDKVVLIEDVGEKRVYDVTVPTTDRFIASGFRVHNCSEGSNCGGWRERSLPKLVEAMDTTIQRCAPNTLSPFSFNSSFYGHFIDFFYEVTKRFSAASLLNSRTDVVSVRSDYLQAVDVLGITSMSLPIEGLGERIRNKVLNKNLSFDQIKKAFRNAFELGIIRLKIGIVLTCHETAEDLQEAAKELEEILAMKEEFNVGAMIQMNFCLLVHYPGTGLAWKRRNSTLMSIKKVRGMKPFMEQFRGRIKFKFSSKEYGTFIEQACLDLGRLSTDIWEKAANQGHHYWGSSYQKALADLVMGEMTVKGITLEEMVAERPFDWIFPVDMVEIKKKSYLKQLYDNVGKNAMIPCLDTPVGRKNKCWDCGYCRNNEDKKKILKRDLTNVHTVADLQEARFAGKPACSYRVAFRVKKEWELLGKESLAHYIASRVLTHSGEWQKFYNVQNVSNYPMMQGGTEDWSWGSFFFDLNMKSKLSEKAREGLVERLQGVFETSEVFNITDVREVSRRLQTDIKVVHETTLMGMGVEKVRLLIQAFNGKVKFGTRGLGGAYMVNTEEKVINFVPEINISSGEQGARVSFVVPININPQLFLSSLLKISYKKVMEICSVQVVGYFKGDSGFCKCGRVKETSLSTMKEPPLCVSCIAKMSLRK